jgi:DNA helicase II / ATP-dependent DNA helicase PcrA
MSKRLLTPDTETDVVLRDCITPISLRNFSMIAGAGSGKTTSLVKALYHALKTREKTLKASGQKIACITYTEIAAKEIWDDVGNNPLVIVSTIHSFLWQITSPFQTDIKEWVQIRIDEKIDELQKKAATFSARTRQTTRDSNARNIEKLLAHKTKISSISKFSYGTGSDYSKGILGHDDIINLATYLMINEPLLSSIVAQKYPVIFVDESQDTNPIVVAALKVVADANPKFCLGFFGDPMQKIYLTGSGHIQLEPHWQEIRKPENFRSSLEVLDVINTIRDAADGLKQVAGKGEGKTVTGSAKIFVLPNNGDKGELVKKVRLCVAKSTGDELWNTDSVKLLVLVHRMAAIRLGFADLYSALNDNSPSALKDGLQDGSAWPLKPFLKFLMPLIDSSKQKDDFRVISLLREYCPLLKKDKLQDSEIPNILSQLATIVDELVSNIDKGASVKQVLAIIKDQQLYEFEERFNDFLAPSQSVVATENAEIANEDSDEDGKLFDAMAAFLNVPVIQFWGYRTYIEDQSPFSTQHGIKGAEFDRVLTILDDSEANYNQYSYNKFFGVTPLSERDIENRDAGEETTIDRTRRLFYVCCSRAVKDLVVIYFVTSPEIAVQKVNECGMFKAECIFSIEDIT